MQPRRVPHSIRTNFHRFVSADEDVEAHTTKVSRIPLSSVSFPPDLFYSHIIPDILSEHLHQWLVEDITPKWHPFYVLPLVSRGFNTMCKMMCANIFGLEKGEGPDKILSVLGQARDSWAQARLPALAEELQPILHPRTFRPYTHADMMSPKGLVQVYICTAIATILFKFDIQRALELDAEDSKNSGTDLTEGVRLRRFRMKDEVMHRVYLPLTCAIELCDSIRPDRLAYLIANHLADILPRYATAPVLLKYTQDLEIYIMQQHRVNLETWVEWTARTLCLIEETQGLLARMQETGNLVRSFTSTSCIPPQVLDETYITLALDDVSLMDWGNDSQTITGHAGKLLDKLESY